MRSLLLPLLPLLVFGCSQNPHVDIASSPVHATSANAQRTEPGLPPPTVTPAPVDPRDPAPGVDKDRDGDGVPDIYDDCPNVPGQVFNNGCPMDRTLVDRDEDGVPDIYDKCPDVPGQVYNDGCPIDGASRPIPPPPTQSCPYRGGEDDWHRVMLEVKESLKFNFDKATIKPESYPALQRLERFLRRYPLSHLYMVGHTDDVGSDAYNMSLSYARVYAVKDFLLRNGLPAYRITLDARGESEPLVSVDDKRGAALDWARSQNRRVDLDVRWEVTERW